MDRLARAGSLRLFDGFKHLLQPGRVEADKNLIADDDCGCGAAVQFDEFAQGARVSLYVPVFKGNVTGSEKLFGRKARRTSGLTVEDDSLHSMFPW